MDDKHIAAGLTLLADDMTGFDLDIDQVVATARLRAQRRQAVAATAVGTVAVVAVATTVLTTSGVGHDAPAANGTGPVATTSAAAATGPADGEQAQKLTRQLAQANPLPADAVVEPTGATPDTRTAPVFTIALAPGPGGEYQAFARVTRGQVPSDLLVAVSSAADSRTGPPAAGECPSGGEPCTSRTFPDGTRAHVLVSTKATRVGVVITMDAERPDGTLIRVTCSTSGNAGATKGAPAPPLGVEDMFKFATVFTW